MFGDTLLESSSVLRKRKRWPMATAFTVEAVIAAVVVIVPLLSTGVIPVAARVPVYTPLNPVTVETLEHAPTDRTGAPGSTTSASRPTVVTLDNVSRRICLTCMAADPTPNNPDEGPPYNPYVGNKSLPGNLIGNGDDHGPIIKPGPKRIISQLTEAQLLSRVEPVYPRIATLAGIQGQVKLHAIIARDGTIQSLSAISGHPLLVHAALDAVGQWRYRPYFLNGEAVEVETFITVNFRKDAH
jgi:periplasmic protein TonB